MALKTGDRVGLFAFDARVRLFAEPQGGVHAFGRLQRQTTALAYSAAETNFTLGLVELGQRLRRRSLVVVLTDFVDTVTAELMVENLARLPATTWCSSWPCATWPSRRWPRWTRATSTTSTAR